MKPADQPPPMPNARRPVWELVIEDMEGRDRVGRARYGTPLQMSNTVTVPMSDRSKMFQAVFLVEEEHTITVDGVEIRVIDRARIISVRVAPPDPEVDDGADGIAPESNEDDIGDQDVDYVDRKPKV